MNNVMSLTKRNLRLFFLDKANVFFSLLSPLILIALYALFLGNLQIDNLTEQLPDASPEEIQWFVNAWVFAGIVMITTLTTALAASSVFVDDQATGKLRDFMVSPVKRRELTGGYFLASFVVSTIMSLFILVVGQVFILIQNDSVMAPTQLWQAVAAVLLSSATFASLSSFAATFLKSSGAFAALSTVVGTVAGFLAGAYIPQGTLPTTVVNVMNVLPFAQSAMLIRVPLTADSVNALSTGEYSNETSEIIKSFYGITLEVGSLTITPLLAVLTLGVITLLFSIFGAARLVRKIRR